MIAGAPPTELSIDRVGAQVTQLVRAKIERAIHQALEGILSADDAVAAVIEAAIEREVTTTSADRIAAEGVQLLAMFDRFGADRDAAAKVARACTSCAHERERVAQRVRALARKRKRNAAASFR